MEDVNEENFGEYSRYFDDFGQNGHLRHPEDMETATQTNCFTLNRDADVQATDEQQVRRLANRNFYKPKGERETCKDCQKVLMEADMEYYGMQMYEPEEEGKTCEDCQNIQMGEDIEYYNMQMSGNGADLDLENQRYCSDRRFCCTSTRDAHVQATNELQSCRFTNRQFYEPEETRETCKNCQEILSDADMECHKMQAESYGAKLDMENQRYCSKRQYCISSTSDADMQATDELQFHRCADQQFYEPEEARETCKYCQKSLMDPDLEYYRLNDRSPVVSYYRRPYNSGVSYAERQPFRPSRNHFDPELPLDFNYSQYGVRNPGHRNLQHYENGQIVPYAMYDYKCPCNFCLENRVSTYRYYELQRFQKPMIPQQNQNRRVHNAKYYAVYSEMDYYPPQEYPQAFMPQSYECRQPQQDHCLNYYCSGCPSTSGFNHCASNYRKESKVHHEIVNNSDSDNSIVDSDISAQEEFSVSMSRSQNPARSNRNISVESESEYSRTKLRVSDCEDVNSSKTASSRTESLRKTPKHNQVRSRTSSTKIQNAENEQTTSEKHSRLSNVNCYKIAVDIDKTMVNTVTPEKITEITKTQSGPVASMVSSQTPSIRVGSQAPKTDSQKRDIVSRKSPNLPTLEPYSSNGRDFYRKTLKRYMNPMVKDCVYEVGDNVLKELEKVLKERGKWSEN